MSIFLLDWGQPVVFVHIPKTGGTSIRFDCQEEGPVLFDLPKEWKSYPSFAVVRDPFDRVVSCWKDFRYVRKMTDLSFEKFLREYYDHGYNADRVDSIDHHMAPMTHKVHGLHHADHLLRFSHFQEDYDIFRTSLGLGKKTLPVKRSTKEFDPYCPKREEYIDTMKQCYAQDYKLLDGWYYD